MSPNANPGTFVGSIVALVSAAVGLAVAFGVHITDEQRTAVIAFVTAAIAVAPIVGASFDHSKRQASARRDAAVTIADSANLPSAAKATRAP